MSSDRTLINFVVQHTHVDPAQIQITKLFGQASARQYFRATFTNSLYGQDSVLSLPNSTCIIMQLPNGFSSPAEEVTKVGKDAPKELPFINIQKYLSGLDINVPQIYATDAEKGLLLLEDLGDTLFENLVKKTEGEFFLMYYRKAIELLVEAQMKTRKIDCVAAHRFFDADLLNWEWMHFLEYGIEDRLGIKVGESDRQIFTTATQELTNIITRMPQGFVLRDYQSRNIMFHNFDFYLIDFQDALTGPLLYDLVALLRDSYVAIGQKECESLVDYYAQILPAGHPYFQKNDRLRKDFHLLTLHRKLKDAGRFQYIHSVKKNPNFLVHVPQSLEYVRHAFEMLDGLGCGQKELRKMIGKYLVELSYARELVSSSL